MATAEPTTITKEAVKALRASGTICFRHRCGSTFIEGTQKGVDVSVEVDFKFVQYGDDMIDDPDYKAACFEMFHFNKYDAPVFTFLNLVRPGDNVRVHWVRDNNSNNAEKAGLHTDELQAEISRPNKSHPNKPTRYFFLLSVSVCPDNTARMIQRA